MRRAPVLALSLVLGLFVQGCGLGAEDVPFNVKVTNNTLRAVVDDQDETAGQSVVLEPGQSRVDSEYTNEGVRPDRVTSISGKTLGCLPFQFTRAPPGTLEVKISQMVRCRRWAPGEQVSRDWPGQGTET